MKGLIATLKGIVKIARMVGSDDSGNFRTADLQYLGRTTKGQLFSPYGLIVNPPANSMAVVLAQNAQESNLIALVDDPINRTIKNLKPGEVALSNYVAGQYVYFKENGDAEVKADKVVILVGGTTVTIENGQITVDGADTTLNGNLQVNGNIMSTGNVDADGEVTADASGTGVTLTGHTHANGGLPSMDSAPPTPGT